MTPSPSRKAWRESQAAKTKIKPSKRGKVRFVPLNAVVDGGWLGTLSLRELRVWLVLHRMADKNGNLHASHCTIAARAGMRREHAARTTAQLERRGLLRVRVRGRTVGSQVKRTANEYEMLAPPFMNSASSSTIAEVKSCQSVLVNSATGGTPSERTH